MLGGIYKYSTKNVCILNQKMYTVYKYWVRAVTCVHKSDLLVTWELLLTFKNYGCEFISFIIASQPLHKLVLK